MQKFNDYLTEKQQLSDLFDKMEIELNRFEEDFETVDIQKLNNLYEALTDNEVHAFKIGKKIYKDFIEFENKFETYVKNFEEEKRFTLETKLEEFLNDIQALKKDLFQ
jgi:hypothetical protein